MARLAALGGVHGRQCFGLLLLGCAAYTLQPWWQQTAGKRPHGHADDLSVECIPSGETIMAAIEARVSTQGERRARPARRPSLRCVLALTLSFPMLPAHAIPPPPVQPPLLHDARMVVKVRLVEASNGRVSRITELCEVGGRIPVYSDDGGAASHHLRAIPGCAMPARWNKLAVQVRGAKAVSRHRVSHAVASVEAVPPDAAPACPEICGPQPLADSRGGIRVSGNPKSMIFSLNQNPVSIMNANPTVWLEADVEIVD